VPDIDLSELEARMRPGAWSVTGFLGPTERLTEVLSADAEALDALGVTASHLADRLDHLLGAAKASRDRRATVGPYDVRVEISRGFQLCPWTIDRLAGQCTAGGGVTHASTRWWLRNRTSGEHLQGPGLLVHLMRAHGFFEGRQVPDRVGPEELARILEVQAP